MGEQVDEAVIQAGAIDWNIVMPEIVRNLPNETVDSYFHGKIGADSIDYGYFKECPYTDNFYTQGAEDKEIHYVFSVLAAPYSDGENVLVIANSQSGVDGLATTLLKTMNYNLKTKEFSNISDKIPGVEPSAELLDFAWLSEHPDWIKKIKDRYAKCSTYDLMSYEGGCMVTNVFNDNDVCYEIDDVMGGDVPDWGSKLNITYLWNGKTFELENKK